MHKTNFQNDSKACHYFKRFFHIEINLIIFFSDVDFKVDLNGDILFVAYARGEITGLIPPSLLE